MKKTLIALLMAVIFVLSLTVFVSATNAGDTDGAAYSILGDVNGDGLITNADVLLIYRYIYNSELFPLDVAKADVNSDGNITNADVLKIYRYIYDPELYPLPVDLIPRQGHSAYGYKDLANNPNGEAMQEMYRRLLLTCETFVSNTNDIQSMDGMYILDDIALGDYGLTVDEGIAVWKIFIFENPRYYWISNTLTVSIDDLIVCIDESYASAAYRAECDAAIDNMINDFDGLIDDGMSDLEIAMAAHDFIIGRMDYAYESDGVTPENDIWAHNMIGCAKYGLGVCEAYAETFMYLCRRYDVDTIIVTGKSASTNEDHAWNMLKIDDVWYGVDVTWDETNENDKVSYNWFGMSGESCESGHKADSFDSTGLDYLYRLPEMSERNFELVDMLKNGEFYGTYENIDKAFEHMTDPNADYTLNLYSYSLYGSFMSNVAHNINTKETPAVKSITISGPLLETGGAVSFNTLLYVNNSLTLFADTLTLNDIELRGEKPLYIQNNCLEISGSGYLSYIGIPVIGNIEDGATSKIVSNINGDFLNKVTVYELDVPSRVTFRGRTTIVNLKAKVADVYGGDLNVENFYGTYEYCFINLSNKASANIQNLYSDSDKIEISLQFGKLEDFPLLTLGNIDCNITISLSGKVHHLTTDPFGNVLDRYVEEANPFNVTTPIAHLLQKSDFEKIKIIYDNLDGDSTSWYLVNSNGDIVLKPYSIENGLTIIDNTVISYDGTAEILNIPNGVTSIGEYAFQGCTSLKNVIIPDSVTSIGLSAFKGCTSLESITIPFVGESKNETSYTNFGYIFGAPHFSHNSTFVPNSLKTVIITGGTSIEPYAFSDCTSLISITIPDSVTSIGYYAFNDCTSLESITLGDGLTTLGGCAFDDCASLKSIIIPDSVTSFGSGVFDGCTALESMTVPFVGLNKEDTSYTYVSTIFGSSISKTLKHIIITCDTMIRPYTFKDCTSLESIVISNGVTSIESSAFENCTSLKSITIPDSVTSIGYFTFYGCTSLKDVYYTGTEEQWNQIYIYSANNCLTNATIHYNYVAT